MSKVIKIICAIPSEGHTLPEALDPLLIMALNLGKLETETELLSQMRQKTPEIVQDFLESHPYLKDLKEDIVFQFYWGSVGRLFTPIARDTLAKRALESGFDYILFMDDDMIIPKDAFFRLWKHDKDIVGALGFTRNMPHDPVLYLCREGFENGMEYFVNLPVRNYPKNQLVRVDAVGFGCVLIKMEVFKKMKAPWFMSTSPCGEDIYFCYQAGKIGAKIYMDTSVKCGHIGNPSIVTEETFEKVQPEEERKQKESGYFKYSLKEEEKQEIPIT